MKKLQYYLIYFSIFLTMLSCSLPYAKYKGEITPGKWLTNLHVEYMIEGKKKYVLIQIYFPKGYMIGKLYRTIICLHSYNKNLHEWEVNSEIEKYADIYNFILVCPNMKTTTYETKYYPETGNRWNSLPGGRWIATILIPYLRNQFAIAYEREKTGILGCSIGGRGAILIACSYPDTFGAAAGLSGYYDALAKTDDESLISIYGDYNIFSKRWEKDDNILKLAVNLKKIPVFLAHGIRDWKIPFEQSRILAIRLKQLQKKDDKHYKFEYHEKKYKIHDWKFWRGMLPEMMFFLNQNLNRNE